MEQDKEQEQQKILEMAEKMRKASEPEQEQQPPAAIDRQTAFSEKGDPDMDRRDDIALAAFRADCRAVANAFHTRSLADEPTLDIPRADPQPEQQNRHQEQERDR